MLLIYLRGRGFLVPFLIAFAMFAPMIALRQIDGPEIDHGVGLTMGVMAVIVFILGWRFNRETPKGERAWHSFMFVPMHYWAVPMLIFAVLLGTRTITTEESGPRQTGQYPLEKVAPEPPTGKTKP